MAHFDGVLYNENACKIESRGNAACGMPPDVHSTLAIVVDTFCWSFQLSLNVQS